MSDKKDDVTVEETSFFGLFKDGYVAHDNDGHSGEGNTAAEAVERLEQAQELDVEWSKPLATGPKVER